MSRPYGYQLNTKEDQRRRIVSGEGAFGDIITAGLTPMCQREFSYGGHGREIYEFTQLGGAIAYADSMAQLSTGTSVGGTAFMRTDRHVRYRPGQGVLMRFTALFDTPVYLTSQTAGAYGGSENGLFVGYNYLDTELRFGFCRQSDGAREVYQLEVTTSASGSENVTVTLNGTGYVVAVTSGTAEENAQELAGGTFTGWTAEASGEYVNFLATNVGARDGSYSASSTGTLAGTMTQKRDGVAVTENWFYQEDWNVDKMDGTGPSGQVLDPTKGNVYSINFQYLGFGDIQLSIEDSDTGRPQLVHVIKYANTATQPSSSNPIYALGAACFQAGSGVSKTVKVGSVAGFVEGVFVQMGPDHGKAVSGSVGGTSEVPVLSLRVNEIFIDGVSKINLREIVPTAVNASATGSNRPIIASIVLNGTLTDPLWTEFKAGESFVSVDESATGISGGDVLAAVSFDGSGGGASEDLTQVMLRARPGDILSVVIETTGNAADYVASIAWKEDS
jgi:hypothetical protein